MDVGPHLGLRAQVDCTEASKLGELCISMPRCRPPPYQ